MENTAIVNLNSVEIDQEFIEKYGAVREVLFNSYCDYSTYAKDHAIMGSSGEAIDAEIKNTVLNGVRILLAQTSQGGLMNDDTADAVEVFMHSREDLYSVFEFLSLAFLGGFFELSNLDMIFKEGNFAYGDAIDAFRCELESLGVKNSKMAEKVFKNLASRVRGITLDAYLNAENKFYLEDLNSVVKLFNKQPVITEDNNLRNAADRKFQKRMLSAVNKIVQIYEQLLGAAYGLDRYAGVLYFGRVNSAIGLSESRTLQPVEPEETLRRYYIPCFSFFSDNVYKPSERIGDKSFSSRQFNAATIFRAYTIQAQRGVSPDAMKAVYFPKKVLELISLSKWSRTYLDTYRACKSTSAEDRDSNVEGADKNLQTYLSYLKTEFLQNVFDYVIFTSKMLFKQMVNLGNTALMEFLSDRGIDMQGGGKEFDTALAAVLGTTEKYDFIDALEAEVYNYLDYYTKCVTTCAIIQELKTVTTKSLFTGTKESQVTTFRFKVSGSFPLISNNEFVTHLSEVMTNTASIAGGDSIVETNEYHDSDIMVTVKDYAYVLQPKLANTLPLFAYKALDALKRQGNVVDWENMLLGKLPDGTLLQSHKGSEIDFLDSSVHYLIAGSRSGKGVMGYSLFAAAINSGAPLFYLDRKPDTSTVMQEIAHGGMFAINGGGCDESIDYNGIFSENRLIGADGNRKSLPQFIKSHMPPYLAPIIKGKMINDVVYFKALLLYLAMVIIGTQEEATDSNTMKMKQYLGGGSILVLDEFTNFCNDFLCNKEQGIFNWLGYMNDNAIQGILTKHLDTIAKAKDEKKESAYVNFKSEPKKLEVLQSLYFAKLSEVYRSIVMNYSSLKNAGGNNAGQPWKTMHVFIIGQELDVSDLVYSEDLRLFHNSVAGSSARYSRARVEIRPSPIQRMFSTRDTNFILGYQPSGTYTSILAQKVGNSRAQGYLSLGSGYFAFHGKMSLTTTEVSKMLTTADSFKQRVSDINQYLNEWTFFKPFLILNNSVVPPQDCLEDLDTDSAEEKKAKAALRGGKLPAGRNMTPEQLMPYRQGQFVGQCLNRISDYGLSYKDLEDDNRGSSGGLDERTGFEGYIKDLGGAQIVDRLSLSGEIANFFVKEILGYNGTWEEYLYDFSEETLFTIDDITTLVQKKGEGADVSIQSAELVRERLKDSFFSPIACRVIDGQYSMAEAWKDKLGKFYRYYEADSSSSVSGDMFGDSNSDSLDVNMFDTFSLSDSDFDKPSALEASFDDFVAEGSENEAEGLEEVESTADTFEDFDDISSEESNVSGEPDNGYASNDFEDVDFDALGDESEGSVDAETGVGSSFTDLSDMSDNEDSNTFDDTDISFGDTSQQDVNSDMSDTSSAKSDSTISISEESRQQIYNQIRGMYVSLFRERFDIPEDYEFDDEDLANIDADVNGFVEEYIADYMKKYNAQ